MNLEHVEIVRQGKEAIDEWRQAHPEERLDLSGANLVDVDLSEANLADADLSVSKLHMVDLTNSLLISTNLSEASLFRANLFGADLGGANLSNAVAFRADFSTANLKNTDLSGANLMVSNLTLSSLQGAKLTGAKLYGSARDDWRIQGVECRYVFWDVDGKERIPKDRDFGPGEFERLYAQLPTIEYIFEQGMTPLDPLVMDRVVQAINEGSPEFDLQIDSINARGLHPTIKFTVQHEEHKAAALEKIIQQYAITNAQLQGANAALSGVIDQMIRSGQGGPVSIGPNSTVAIGPGSSVTINTDEYIGHLEEIERAIKEAPSVTLSDAGKREALEIVSGTFKDLAKGKAKEVAEAIVQLGLKIGPSVVNTQAYEFFKNLPQ